MADGASKTLAQVAAIGLRFRQLCERQAQRIFSRPFYIIVLILFIGLQLVLLYWSLQVRLPLLQQTNQMMISKSLLQTTLIDKQDLWSSSAIDSIEDKILMAEQSVFSDFKSLLYWLAEQQTKAHELGFELDYQLAELTDEKINRTYVLPVEMRLRSQQQYPAEQFSKLQDYTYQLIGSRYHVEVVELEALSQSFGLSQLNLQLLLWIHDPDDLLQRPQQEEADVVPFIQ